MVRLRGLNTLFAVGNTHGTSALLSDASNELKSKSKSKSKSSGTPGVGGGEACLLICLEDEDLVACALLTTCLVSLRKTRSWASRYPGQSLRALRH